MPAPAPPAGLPLRYGRRAHRHPGVLGISTCPYHPEEAGLPVYGGNRRVADLRRDILAANPVGRALYSLVFDGPHRPVNTSR